MIYIGNLRKKYDDEILQVRVDRSSPLGNPFFMKNENQRDDVCDAYEQYFNMLIKDQSGAFYGELNRIISIAKTQDVRLMCWCSPKRCHSETIKNYIEKEISK